jgi:hypothetical protein
MRPYNGQLFATTLVCHDDSPRLDFEEPLTASC